MTHQELARWVTEAVEDQGWDLPRSYLSWAHYVEEGPIIDRVVDDLDRYLPTWERLDTKAFEDRVCNLEVPSAYNKLETLYSQWLDMATPF